jgi:hypothetical protein
MVPFDYDGEHDDDWLPDLDFHPFLPYNKATTGVIGVDLGDCISGGEPRCRWPRKKRQKQQTRTLTSTRSLPNR